MQPDSEAIPDYTQEPSGHLTVTVASILGDVPQPKDWILKVIQVTSDSVVVFAHNTGSREGDSDAYHAVVTALDHTGKRLWTVDSKTVWGDITPSGRRIDCAPVTSNIVCMASDSVGSGLTVIRAVDGTTRNIRLPNSKIASSAPPGVVALGDDVLVWGISDDGIYKVRRYSLTDERDVWSVDIAFHFQVGYPTPIAVGDYLEFAAHLAGGKSKIVIVDANNGEIVTKLNDTSPVRDEFDMLYRPATEDGQGAKAVTLDGTVRWEYPSGNIASYPASPGDLLLMTDPAPGARELFALNPDTGKRMWSASVAGYAGVYQDGPAVFASGNGKTSVVSAKSGAVIETLDGDELNSNSEVFFVNNPADTLLQAYALDTGAELWKLDARKIGATDGKVQFGVSFAGAGYVILLNGNTASTILFP